MPDLVLHDAERYIWQARCRACPWRSIIGNRHGAMLAKGQHHNKNSSHAVDIGARNAAGVWTALSPHQASLKVHERRQHE